MTKHLKIIEYAISSLLRNRFKSVAILVAYSATVAALASVLLLTHSLKTETAAVMKGVPDLIVQRTMGGRHELIPVAYREKMAKILGIGEITPRYWGYYYDGLTKANYTLMGTGGETAPLTMLQGRLPASEEQCAIGSGIATLWGAGRSREIIMINSENMGVLFSVSGIFRSESDLLTNDLVVLTDRAVIDFFSYPEGMATDFAITVPNSSEVQTVAAKIKKLLPDTRPITRRELVRTYDMVFDWRSGMMLTVFSAAVIALCIMAWDKATGISAEEKREIGILKAIGWDTSDILALKFWEGLTVSLTAFLTGIIISYVHVFFFDGYILAAVMKGWSVLFPAFRLMPSLNLFHLLVMGVLTVVPYVASTVIPTWKTAITDPDAVMRG